LTKWQCACGEIIRHNTTIYHDGQAGKLIGQPNCPNGHGFDSLREIE